MSFNVLPLGDAEKIHNLRKQMVKIIDHSVTLFTLMLLHDW
jgi:hypothetical protein